MAKARLTERVVASLRAPPDERLELFDQDVRGLILRVSPTGKKSWVFRYRTRDGQQRRHALGIYLADYRGQLDEHVDPAAKKQVLSLAQARALARDIINQVGRGQDPSAERERALEEARAEPIKTLNDLKDAYFAAVESGEWRPRTRIKKDSTVKRERQMWAHNVEVPLGRLELEHVTADAIKRVLRAIVARGHGTQSNRVRALLRQVLNYGVAEDKIAANPMVKVKALVPEFPRERVLSDGEIQRIWRVLENPAGLKVPQLDSSKSDLPLQVSEQIRLILKLLLLTLARRSEVCGMRVDELDFQQNVWVIPGTRTKNGRSNFIPLAPFARELIERALAIRSASGLTDSPYVFASARHNGDAVTPNPVSHGMRDICRALAITNVTTHDLRRTAASNMVSERLKVPPYLVSRILNHSGENGGAASVTMRVYALYDYASEKRAALGAWAELLACIVSSEGEDRLRPIQIHQQENNIYHGYR